LFLYFTFLLTMHTSDESTPPPFIEDGGWMDVCEVFDVLPSLHFIWPHSVFYSYIISSLAKTLIFNKEKLSWKLNPL